MNNDLVYTSRAGDVFHYRWAARRCLKMLSPTSTLEYVIIEGSDAQEADGEYVIDVAEYYSHLESEFQDIIYYQLKHSIKRVDQPFNLSDLKGTIEGFAKRFSVSHENVSSIKFSIITNRPFSDIFKDGIEAVANGDTVTSSFQKTLKKYTRLSGQQLQDFCSSLELTDSEGDYNVQRYELQDEIAEFISGTVDGGLIESVVALVQDPGNFQRRIEREDVLKRLGVTSEQELFPAKAEFDELIGPIEREQHDELLGAILVAETPIVIHASGGVGKTVVARQLADSLPNGSVGVVYDCFGSGKYRNISQSRHRFDVALVQIINELASKGLCSPLIPRTVNDTTLVRTFLLRIKTASQALRIAYKDAVLAIFLDAADNAEMAAQEFNEIGFAHQLLKEVLPEGCRLIALCRTERRHLLITPSSFIGEIELQPFSSNETLVFMQRYFPEATPHVAEEFYRLTGGNPRVQANALENDNKTIQEIFSELGPSGTTVDQQIAQQLEHAVKKIKEEVTPEFERHVEDICRGLAVLPPLIPLEVLAAAADIDKSSIHSFVADLGRPLWLSDNAVQFRDEPTETWFRESFSATKEQVYTYVERLMPLATRYVYVAEVLPALLLQAGRYDDLIALALSDEALPDDSPIDLRNIRVYRLQFALKAALKQKRYADATKLALRAGEETAGEKRQIELLNSNLDLIAPLQSPQRVQELAFRRQLQAAWEGSENIYSAALLSTVDDYKGEARGYYRTGRKWLKLYFEERQKDEERYDHRLEIVDILEMAYTVYNLDGIKAASDFLVRWDTNTRFELTRLLVSRLIDFGHYSVIDNLAEVSCRDQYMILAITQELIKVGRILPGDSLIQCLDLMTHKRSRIVLRDDYRVGENKLALAVVSFCEMCVLAELPKRKVQRVLNHFTPKTVSRMSYDDYHDYERKFFLRAAALKVVLSNNKSDFDIQPFKSKELLEKKSHDNSDVKRFEEIIGAIYPWYLVRANIINGEYYNVSEMIAEANKYSSKARVNRWREHDRIPHEIAKIHFDILSLLPAKLKSLPEELLATRQDLYLPDRLNALYSAYRQEHLASIRAELERICFQKINEAREDGPEIRADWYIKLARAVLVSDIEDAKAYFDNAIEAVSKFGDELVHRWEAVESLAKRAADGGFVPAELAYRFARCIELVGDNVYKEKHFDRNGAVGTLCRLHPPSAFAVVSRWRDRDVGDFERQAEALAYTVLDMGVLSANAGWSLSGFFTENIDTSFIKICLEKAQDDRVGQILDHAIYDYRLNDASRKSWEALEVLTQQYSHENETLKDVLKFFSQSGELPEDASYKKYAATSEDESTKVDWDQIFGSVDLSSDDGLSIALHNFEKIPEFYNRKEFWIEVIGRIQEGDAKHFLETLPLIESIDIYDIESIFRNIPSRWLEKVSIQKIWLTIIYNISRCLATDLIHSYYLKKLIACIPGYAEKEILPSIQEGVINGLTESSRTLSADEFFDFVGFIAQSLTFKEANELLSFALERFEEHLDKDYADGAWDYWLMPPDNITDAVTGFIWSALGSPRSSMRWKAAHCVRKLAKFDCNDEIDALIRWMELDSINAFGSKEFPFYNLHARQYLLIALARVAIDKAENLTQYQQLFIRLALHDMEHIIIQKFAADIALNVEKKFPGISEDENIVEKLSSIDKSLLPIQKSIEFRKNIDTIWHQAGKVDTSLKLYFSYDFDRYWFEPLGEVFGVASAQVEDLAREVILKDWNTKIDDEYIRDPRQHIWNSYRHEHETWHSHSDYPRTDDYSFYLSYHAMMCTAMKLLQHMPILKNKDWCEDCWLEWLQRHLLADAHGKWLSERRDPAPLKRRRWLVEKQSDNWLNTLEDNDFLEGLMKHRQDQVWLNVYGHWNDNDYTKQETYHVSSALVSKKSADALLNALTTCQDPWDYKLPNYEEERVEFNTFPFELQGWITYENETDGIDSFDPYANGINHSPYQVGELIRQKLSLTHDTSLRNWYVTEADEPSLVSEIWSDERSTERDELFRSGNCISASLDTLKLLCKTFECELIISVEINRHIDKHYHRKESDEQTSARKHRVYIFSSDGGLRDSTKNYTFG